MKPILLLLSLICLSFGEFSVCKDNVEEFLAELSVNYSKECNEVTTARWNYTTDLKNEDAKQNANTADLAYLKFQSEVAQLVQVYKYTEYGKDKLDSYRQCRFQKDRGLAGLGEEKLKQYNDIELKLNSIYNDATFCAYNSTEKCDYKLSDLKFIMKNSTDWEELKYVWEEWRKETGKNIKNDYYEMISLANQSAVLDGYKNLKEYWLNGYTVTEKEKIYDPINLVEMDADIFIEKLDKIWTEVKEQLYKPLHAYVRNRLKKYYPQMINDKENLLPAHVLGSMWAEDWSNIAKYVMDFEKYNFDVTPAMEEQKWTIDRMYASAADFFVSMKLKNMTGDFWEKSVIDKDAKKEMVCDAEAVDFCLGPNNTDFRIRMCTNVNMKDLITVHKEMAKIEYFMAYKEAPHVFRQGANPAFHDAVAGMIELSVATRDHMQKILKLKDSSSYRLQSSVGYSDEKEEELVNFLLQMALEKVAFLPFAYLVDKYRWRIFKGEITKDNYNSEWWRMQEEIQGVTFPAEMRSNEFFDPGSLLDVGANKPYISHFVSSILQFQLHEYWCGKESGTTPIQKCDLYGTSAGKLLAPELEKGFSEPWPMTLKQIGGDYDMMQQSLLEYFAPLIQFLKKNVTSEDLIWGSVINKKTDAAVKEYGLMEIEVTNYVQNNVQATWDYHIDMTTENHEAQKNSSLQLNEVYKNWWNKLIMKNSDYEYIKSDDDRRKFYMIKNIGEMILDKEDLEKLNTHKEAMLKSYQSRVCQFGKTCNGGDQGMDIDSLEREMAVNGEYSELLYYWENWRKISGSEITEDFHEYVKLTNKAAEMNKFKNTGEMWTHPYTTRDSSEYTHENFLSEIDEIWTKLKPFYTKLHGYVRFKLSSKYEKFFHDDNLIPAHILGNMWAQSWENIYDKVAPYEDVHFDNVTGALQKYSAEEMAKASEKFFTSMKLPVMNVDFWKNSVFEKPENNKTIDCHPSAFDFYSTEKDNTKNGKFRLKMCVEKTQEDFISLHKEMSLTQYQMAYSQRPLVYRDGANPGFHEAIGGAIELSAQTPTHLRKIFPDVKPSFSDNVLAKNRTQEEKENINFLMKLALKKFAFLPYAYILDQWRWEVFTGNITDENYNREWWAKRIDYQGLCPPIKRLPYQDFDIASKYDVLADVPYISYFVADILQFQFHERLCQFKNKGKPLVQCDIFEDEKAGSHLFDLLKKGASKPWQIQLEEFLKPSNSTMSADVIIDYFSELWNYIDEQQKEHNFQYGWKGSNETLDNYISTGGDDVPPVVPIVVGVILVVLVAIVLIAFFVGQKRRKAKERKMKETRNIMGTINEGMEMGEK